MYSVVSLVWGGARKDEKGVQSCVVVVVAWSFEGTGDCFALTTVISFAFLLLLLFSFLLASFALLYSISSSKQMCTSPVCCIGRTIGRVIRDVCHCPETPSIGHCICACACTLLREPNQLPNPRAIECIFIIVKAPSQLRNKQTTTISSHWNGIGCLGWDLMLIRSERLTRTRKGTDLACEDFVIVYIAACILRSNSSI